jgi:hypothetical protein
MFVVLMGVFSLLFAPNPTHKLDLIVGLVLWAFFAEGTKSGLTLPHARGHLLTKARVHSWILALASISNAVVTLVVFRAVIALLLVGFSLASNVPFLRSRDLSAEELGSEGCSGGDALMTMIVLSWSRIARHLPRRRLDSVHT